MKHAVEMESVMAYDVSAMVYLLPPYLTILEVTSSGQSSTLVVFLDWNRHVSMILKCPKMSSM